MRYPIIRVRDKLTGHEHIVGTDTHDTLYVGDDGGIHYYNLQNGEGTGRNGDYEFVGVDDEYALGPEIEFVQVDQTEVQRLRAALTAMRQAVWDELVPIKLVTKINKIADEALSTTTVPTGAERAKAAIADRYKNALHGWHNPVDRAAGSYYNGYLNGVGDTLRLLDITIPGVNAPERVGTEEWRHKYFGAEWPETGEDRYK